MREEFPVTKRGDRLTHQHVNKLSDVCRRVGKGIRGPYINSHSGGSADSLSIAAPFRMEQVIVDSDNSDGTYTIKFRYYDHGATSPTWKTSDEDPPYILDATESGLAFLVGDKLIAYWNAQRDAFMPFGTSAGIVLKIGKTETIVAPDTKDNVINLWEENEEGVLEATGETQTDVRHDWITGNQNIQAETEVIIGYFSSESLWRIIGAECPP